MRTNKTARSILVSVGSTALLVFALSVPASSGQAKPAEGAQVFAKQCAGCHGDKGQGGAGYAKPLVGTRSLAELSKFIHTSMPPSGKKLAVADAEKVAGFIFNEFYSPLAQERNRPARVELARLTVKQFKNAVADILSDSRPVIPDAPHGLKGEYFKARDFSAKGKVFDRVDPEVNFDFGTAGPTGGEFDPYTFSAAWQGSVLAPDTGIYDIIVKTSHSVRVWMNSGKEPLIDAIIKSGNETEYRGSISLLGGRAYPIRIEFTKASQGVVDPKKKETKPPAKSFITLMWKRAKFAVEPIPSRCLFSQPVPQSFVVTTPFPPDDRSIGYERGNAFSKDWDDATTAAAFETANYVVDNLSRLAQDSKADRKERLKDFCRKFAERAFRRPLTQELLQTYVDKQFQVAPNDETAVKRVIVLVLKSPRFLYREIGTGPKDDFQRASDLSFGLWDTIPDLTLNKAANAGTLNTREQVYQQAERLAKDPRAWSKLREFLLAWLKVDEVPDIVKSTKIYPFFDDAIVSDLRTSLELFLESTAWSETSDFRDLLLSNKQFINGRLSRYYGNEMPANAQFQEVTLDPTQRSGVLTHPYLLSRFAYLDNSSPIHRGVLIVRSMLGRTLLPPPSAFTPDPQSLHPKLTTRERVAQQTKPAMCNACHSIINPLGFTLEKFDSIGKIRQIENGKPVDTSGSYKTKAGTVVKFTGAPDLAKYIAGSDEAHAAFVEKMFQHLVKQPVRAYGPRMLSDLQLSFENNRYSIRNLMVLTMVSSVMSPAKK